LAGSLDSWAMVIVPKVPASGEGFVQSPVLTSPCLHPLSQKVHQQELREVAGTWKMSQVIWHTAQGPSLPGPQARAGEENLRSAEERPQVNMAVGFSVLPPSLPVPWGPPVEGTEGTCVCLVTKSVPGTATTSARSCGAGDMAGSKAGGPWSRGTHGAEGAAAT
jgi:hypothetical protein